jgi:limonene-1,2-epoxide hydrolase
LEDFANVDNIVGFFADDGVYIDPMRGVQRGLEELRTEFTAQAAMGFENVKIDVRSLVVEGGTVMMERQDSWTVGGEPFSLEVMAVMDFDPDGRVKRWRDSYDSKPIRDQLTAAGYRIPR